MRRRASSRQRQVVQRPRTIDHAAKPATATPISPFPNGGPAPCPRITDEPRTASAPPPLAKRIRQLVSTEPFEDAIASMGMVSVFLLLSEATDPLQALDGLAAKMRQMLIEAKRKDEAARLVH